MKPPFSQLNRRLNRRPIRPRTAVVLLLTLGFAGLVVLPEAVSASGLNAVNRAPTVPAGPSSLEADLVTTTEVDLQWVDDSTNEDGYSVYRATGPGGTPVQIAALPAGVDDLGAGEHDRVAGRAVHALHAAGNLRAEVGAADRDAIGAAAQGR